MSTALDLSTLMSVGIRPGRRGSELPFAVTRELTEEDLLATSESGSIKPASIKELRQSHHELARLLAQGEKPTAISEITGYSLSRISILKADPQFQELLTHYSELENTEKLRTRADYHARLAAVGFDSLEILHQRLLDDPDSITFSELIKITEAIADRTGHGKTSTVNSNVSVLTLNSEELASIRTNSAPREANPASEADRESLLRLAMRGTDTLLEAAKEGSEGEGAGVREAGYKVVDEA